MFQNCGTGSDCYKVTEGEFYYTSPLGGRFELERNSEKQIERDLETGYVSKMNVEWVSNCSCIMTLESSTSPVIQEIDDYTMEVTITSVVDSGYFFISSHGGNVNQSFMWYADWE
jgi:hypothetical protein